MWPIASQVTWTGSGPYGGFTNVRPTAGVRMGYGPWGYPTIVRCTEAYVGPTAGAPWNTTVVIARFPQLR
jgi:hypothetical protein